MGTISRTVVIAVSPLFVCCGTAAADPVPVADVTQSADTDDGWHLSATLTNMTINSVPNMAATALTKEAFVTGKAVAKIDGDGTIPVNSGSLVLGVQLGCQLDLSQGGNLGVSGSESALASARVLPRSTTSARTRTQTSTPTLRSICCPATSTRWDWAKCRSRAAPAKSPFMRPT